MLLASRSRLLLSAPRATVRRRCSVAGMARGASALSGNGAILTGTVGVVCRSCGGCKTPDEGTATGADGGAGRVPEDGYSARAEGQTFDFSDSGAVSGACVTTRSHQGACEMRRRVRADQSFPRFDPCLPRPAREPSAGPGCDSRDQARRLPDSGAPARAQRPPVQPERPQLRRPLPARFGRARGSARPIMRRRRRGHRLRRQRIGRVRFLCAFEVAIPRRTIGALAQGQEPAAPAVKREAEEDWGR